MFYPYFVYIVHSSKFTCGSSLLMEKSFLMENQKRKKVLGKKRKNKSWFKEERKPA